MGNCVIVLIEKKRRCVTMSKNKYKPTFPKRSIFIRIVACVCALLMLGGVILAAISIY